jgi:hypothetical protein
VLLVQLGEVVEVGEGEGDGKRVRKRGQRLLEILGLEQRRRYLSYI